MNHKVRHCLTIRALGHVLENLQFIGPKTRRQRLEQPQRIRPGIVLAQPIWRDVVLVID